MNEIAPIDRPISEQFRIVAKQFVDCDAAATLMEELKSTTLEGLKSQIIQEYEGDIADNAATRLAKGREDWKQYIEEMCAHRAKANKLKVQMEYLRMKHMEQQSQEATARAERKL